MSATIKSIAILSMAVFTMIGADVHAADADCNTAKQYQGRVVSLEPNPGYSNTTYSVTIETTENGQKVDYKFFGDENFGPNSMPGKLSYAALLLAKNDGTQVKVYCRIKNKLADVIAYSYDSSP